jgi:hypothetical protein
MKRWGGHLRRVPRLVRPRWEWAEEGIRCFEEFAEAASPMFIGEGGVHGKIATDKEAHSGDGVCVALVENV